MKTRVFGSALALTLLAAGAALASNRITSSNTEWEPYFGCWQASGAPADEILCIVADGGAVRMVTLVDGAVRADTRIIADGVSRRAQQDGCMNVESARWSNDRRRIFLTSEVTCPGGITRNVRGMLTFLSRDEWLSVQTVTSDDGTATRAVRFTPVEGLRIPGTISAALRSSRMTRVASIAAFDEQDVLEAANYLDAGAIDEWMRVADAPYRVQDGGSNISALDQVGRMSTNVGYVDRGVVRIVERPVYVMRSYGRRTYSSCWTPWGYDHFGWHATRSYVRIRHPVVIHIGSRDRHWDRDDHWRSGRDYGRDDHSRDRHDRDDRSRDARATRDGYSRDGYARDRRDSRETQPARGTVSRSSGRSSTARSQPQRAPTTTKASTSRTAKPRASRKN